MMLLQATSLDEPDLSRFAWSGLRRFRNILDVENRIVHLHNLDARHRSNARKQATQMRYCLIQAQEYFDAAATVTLATKPLLLYYCIMNLALAEILLKQSGESSLDRAREQNNHHGLLLRINNTSREYKYLEESSETLRAKPLIYSNGNRIGTFELWHRSCRFMPLAGTITQVGINGSRTTHFGSIGVSSDNCPPPVSDVGISLLDCFRHLPGMMETMHSFGITPCLVRGQIMRTFYSIQGRYDSTIILHPGPHDLVKLFLNNVEFHSDGVDQISFQDIQSGGIIEWINTPENPIQFRIPDGTTWNTTEVRFWTSPQPVNEFGYLYVALYILGNYARYFPDLWMRDVEQTSPLALAVEKLLEVAAVRMPLVALSEMTRTCLVPAR